MRLKIKVGLIIICTILADNHALAQQSQAFAKIKVDEKGNVKVLKIDKDSRQKIHRNRESLNSVPESEQSVQSSQPPSDSMQENRTFSMSPGDDLWISGMGYEFTGPDLSIDVSVGHNHANSFTVFKNVKLGYYLSINFNLSTDDTQIACETLPDMPAPSGMVQTGVTTNISPYPGIWYVGVIVDDENKYDEEDSETNNKWTAPNILSCAADLAFITSNCDYNLSGGNIHADVEIINNGSLGTGVIRIDFYLSNNPLIQPDSDTNIGSRTTQNLNPGQSRIESYSFDYSDYVGSEWYLGAIIEPTQSIHEGNYSNNDYTFSPKLQLLSDLTYVSDHCHYSYSDPDLAFNIRITNIGNVPSGSFPVDFYLSQDDNIRTSDPNLCTINFTGLAVGGHADKVFSVNVSSYQGSNWYVGFIINKDDTEPEMNGGANIYYFPDLLALDASTPLPDLIVSDLLITDVEEPRITCKATVENIGEASVTQDFKCHFYLSADQSITSSDYYLNDWNVNQPLYSGQTKQSYDIQSTISGVPAGSYYLGVIADGNHVIAESDENNNTAYAASPAITISGNGGGETTENILEVPMAGIAPVIDGTLDPVWYSVCSVPMEKIGLDDDTAPDHWLDAFSSFKMMYDEQYFYIFFQAHDDIVNISNSDAWENDSFELFFDGDNSKNDLAAGYDGNDKQLRYIYGQTSENIGTAPNSTCSFIPVDNGYNCEIRIPAQDMTFSLIPGHTFGFEAQFNDNDSGGRDHQLKWWSASNDTWQDASLFGTARTTDYVASDPMRILQAQGAPIMDGIADETVWEDVPWFTDNTFVTQTDGNPLSPPFDITRVNNWNDCRFNWKMMWQGSMLYLCANVFDDIIDTGHADGWMNDGFQIFIDGNNDKNVSDPNDGDFSFVYSTVPTADAAFVPTSSGYSFECRLNLNSELGIGMYQNKWIGFEISLNDNDGGGRDLWTHWWSNDDISWSDPGMLGTIELAGSTVNVEEPDPSMIQTFHLAQNYPNPFNPSTKIQYGVPKSCHVILTIYDLLGKEIATLVNEMQSPGQYAVKWSGHDFSSGIYIVHLNTGKMTKSLKMILQK